jgi:hypothetical protein
MECGYVRDYYGVPARIGRRIVFQGKRGTIVEDRGHYIGVNFDLDKPGVILNLHPLDEVAYKGMGKVRKMTRSQQRYRDYVNSEYPGTFKEWLGIK